MIKLSLSNKKMILRWSVRVSFALCFFGIAFFSLTNAGITNYAVLFLAISVYLGGIVATSLIKERIETNYLHGIEPSNLLMQCAIFLPIALFVAFFFILAIQLA